MSVLHRSREAASIGNAPGYSSGSREGPRTAGHSSAAMEHRAQLLEEPKQGHPQPSFSLREGEVQGTRLKPIHLKTSEHLQLLNRGREVEGLAKPCTDQTLLAIPELSGRLLSSAPDVRPGLSCWERAEHGHCCSASRVQEALRGSQYCTAISCRCPKLSPPTQFAQTQVFTKQSEAIST